MLLVIEPLTLVHGAISVNEDAVTVGLAVLPLTLIDVAVSMSHAALAIELSILGHAVVRGAVRELNDTNALPDALLVQCDIGLVFPLGEFLWLAIGIVLTHSLSLLD